MQQHVLTEGWMHEDGYQNSNSEALNGYCKQETTFKGGFQAPMDRLAYFSEDCTGSTQSKQLQVGLQALAQPGHCAIA